MVIYIGFYVVYETLICDCCFSGGLAKNVSQLRQCLYDLPPIQQGCSNDIYSRHSETPGAGVGLMKASRNVGPFRARSLSQVPPIPVGCDEEIFSRSTALPHECDENNESGYVMLAGCGRNELAYENSERGGGCFTTKLLDILWQPRSRQITYSSVVNNLNLRKEFVCFRPLRYSHANH